MDEWRFPSHSATGKAHFTREAQASGWPFLGERDFIAHVEIGRGVPTLQANVQVVRGFLFFAPKQPAIQEHPEVVKWMSGGSRAAAGVVPRCSDGLGGLTPDSCCHRRGARHPFQAGPAHKGHRQPGCARKTNLSCCWQPFAVMAQKVIAF